MQILTQNMALEAHAQLKKINIQPGHFTWKLYQTVDF